MTDFIRLVRLRLTEKMNMNINLDYVKEILEAYGFPEKTFGELYKCYKGILPKKEQFEQQIILYENDMLFSFGGSIKALTVIAENTNQSKEALYLLYALLLTKHLREKYKKRNIDNKCFDGVIEDIKVKNDECFTVYGKYGLFVPDWFGKFFSLSRFVFGRLQFEPKYVLTDIEINGIKLYERQLCIGIHIPSGKPLDIEECKKSLSMAYDYFLPYFVGDTIVFDCDSWLLSPQNRFLLNKNSNILKFMDLFYITETDKSVENDLWRIFGSVDISDIDNLPTDTSVRSSYAKYIKSGKMPNCGYGIIVMKNNKDYISDI